MNGIDIEGIRMLDWLFLLVLLVNQVHHHLHHHVFLLCLAFCNHQCQSHEGVISQALRTILTLENTIVIQEPKKQRGSNALIAIAERVILCHQI